MKICISCGSGGHLSQILEIMDAFEGHEYFFVLVASEVTENIDLGKVIYIKKPPKPLKFLNINLHKIQLIMYYLSLVPSTFRILKERPNVILGHGGEASLILFYLGKIFRIKLIYIETVERIKELSGTGKLVYPLTDLFIVQSKELQKKYEKSVYWGKII